MKKVISLLTFSFSFFFIFSLFSFLSCEQPFRAGLGPVIDLQAPTIVLESPTAGEYIRRVTEFTGYAADDYKLESVWFHIANYPNVELPPEYMKKEHDIGTFYKITDTKGNDRNIVWKFFIDTMLLDNNGERLFPDGDFKIRLLAIDHATKEAVTDEIVFYVKNDIPEIIVDAPVIMNGTEPGFLGSEHLNYDYLNNSEPFRRVLYLGAPLVARISDHEGIYQGRQMRVVVAEDGDPILDADTGEPILDKENNIKVDKEGNPKTPKIDEYGNRTIVELFPPQIRFWQVYMDDFAPPYEEDGITLKQHAYLKGNIPSLEQEPWKILGKEFGDLIPTGSNLTFYYTPPEEPGFYYAFQIRAQSIDKVQSKAEYPRDYMNFDFDKAPPNHPFILENSYALFLVREQQDVTNLSLYGLEDIFGDMNWSRDKDGNMQYRRLPEITDQIEIDGNHVYVDKSPVRKGGVIRKNAAGKEEIFSPFTLRMRARNRGNIKSAKVYWEKEGDRSMKGRFIWDPPPVEKPHERWNSQLPLRADPYYKWGLNEPDGGTEVRSYVFTYTDDPAQDRIPNDAAFNSFVMGKSKVQLYTGAMSFEQLEAIVDDNTDKNDWQDYNIRLTEGTYNLTVYARSNSDTRSMPVSVTIIIDRTPPEIGLNDIDGKASDIDRNYVEPVIVNGVIRPKFRITESESWDTGFRTGTISYFEQPSAPGTYYQEQAYILIPEDQKQLMDAYLKDNPWPDFPNLPGTPAPMPVITGVDIKKHGPIVEKACIFRTSKIYAVNDAQNEAPSDLEPDSLPNGNYRLYAFVRDKAFNVNRFDFPIKVDRSTDDPKFDFSVGSSFDTGVIEPDSAYDYKGSKYGDGKPEKSFIIAGNNGNMIPRNKFNSNDYISVKISDDDSLDLGQDADNGNPAGDSKIIVTFIGSRPVEDNETHEWIIKAYEEQDYLITLSDAEIKAIFPPEGYKEETGVRKAVKVKQGRIDQTVLVNRLKTNQKYNGIFGASDTEGVAPIPDTSPKHGYNSLPDGIYRVGISIRDYTHPDIKLKMPDDSAWASSVILNKMPVDAAPPYDKTEYVWIAVDNAKPVIVIDPQTRPSGQIISPTEPSPLIGSVSDENGPITLVDWKVLKGSAIESQKGKTVGTGTPYIEITQTPWGDWSEKPAYEDVPEIEPGTGIPTGKKFKKWNYKFSYKMVMNGRKEGTYNFELTFQDRFQNESTVTLTYSVDNEPPKVSLTKPIETFSRPFDDVDLKPGTYPQNPNNSALNKERLAVKVVNFSINAVDNFMVKGVRWWLLPWNVGAGSGAFNDTGIVSDYNSFPAGTAGFIDPGTYYPTQGAFGVVDVANRQWTIAIDTEQILVQKGNGEYRLHIIAEDDAGNFSTVVTPPIIANSHVFQEVFFLHEEDRPYFGANNNSPDVNNNISPGVAVTGTAWPTANMDVMGGNPIIRGTIFENNGFSGENNQGFWNGSITIWFSNPTTNANADLDPNWEGFVKAGTDITGYIKKQIPDDLNTGLGKSGRNISLAIELAALFPDAFKTDGNKRYIIKATDSPVNKLWYGPLDSADKSIPGTPMGGADTAATTPSNESVRVSRWRQFAFVYDAKPPEVIITNPPKEGENQFGPDFASDDTLKKGFKLEGSISDMNLATTADGKYYFEYYVDSNVSARRKFILEGAGVTVTYDPPLPAIPTKVTFSILPSVVASKIIPNFFNDAPVTLDNGTTVTLTALSEGQHTLNVFAWDKSGKEGAAWVSFTKDMKPPAIAFTNLTGNNRPYDDTNKSAVDKGKNGITEWWGKTAAQRQTLLLGTASADPLPLTTIYYDTGVPELRGTITDLVSNIALKVGANPSVGSGDVNIGDPNDINNSSAFRYWIDNDGNGTAKYLALIDGKGSRSVRWTILLTSDGTLNGTPLPNGVHTIVLTAADETGQEIQPGARYMIAFRIDSKQPRSHVTVSGNTAGVYGNVDQQSSPMFTLNLTADDANLEKVELKIFKKAEKDTEEDKQEGTTQTFTARSSPLSSTSKWVYYPFGDTPSPAITLPSPLTVPASPLADDYVLFTGTYGVEKFATTVSSGKYEAIVTAYDTYLNKSEEYVFPFTYDKDAPVIEFTNPADTNKNTSDTLRPQDFIDVDTLAAMNKINRLTSENLRIQGNVKDAYSAVRQVQSQVWKWNWTYTTGGATGRWEIVEAWKNVRNDLYYTPVGNPAVPDPRNNTLTQISWTKNLLGQNVGDWDIATGAVAVDARNMNIPLTQTELDKAEGLYRIQIRAKDASFTANGGNKDYSNNTWVLTGTTRDIGNPVVSDYEYFYFDRTNPELKVTAINGSDASMATYYSTPPSGGFTFEGTVKDNNRFAKVEVTFVSGANTITRNATLTSIVTPPNQLDPAPTINTGGVTQIWKAEGFTSGANNTLTDGRYKVTITAYDMTGRSTKEEKSFILDSTPPGARFTGPAKARGKGYGEDQDTDPPNPKTGFASVQVNGGELAVITGETWDKPGTGGESGSESGIDKMWFRLGYIDGNNNFPTKALVSANADALITAAKTGDNANKTNNELMDIVSEANNNAWFRLGGTRKPTGFVINNPNIYDWRMEIPKTQGDIPSADKADYDNTLVNGQAITNGTQIGGLKLYGSKIRIKGRDYDVGPSPAGGLQMVRAVDGQAGVYRLPLWIRLVDIAGNVAYYCHDIWIYPDGDIPSTTIESPSNAPRDKARGGTISVDGVAKSNTSVYDVIFRVFADGVADTNLDGSTANPTRPLAADLVKVNGYNPAETATVSLLPSAYQNTAWQSANLTLTGGSGEPLIPWSIMLNSEDQIKNLISTKGFNGGTGAATPKDTIRVWLEVFVFNGEGSPIRSSIYPNDNLNTGGGYLYGTAVAGGARPYVRAFYIKDNAPAITHPNVGSWVGGNSNNPHLNFTWNTESTANPGGGGYKGAGTETRRDRFAFSATLDPNPTGGSGGLGEVAYRIKLDGGAYGTWTTAWSANPPAGTTFPALPENVNSNGVRISRRDATGNRIRYYFDYAVNSKSAAPPTESGTIFAAVNGGNWQYSGGTITVQIRMRDNSNPPNEAEQSIQVSVDNFAPVADTNSYGNRIVAGSNVDFQGRVYDYATAPATDAMNTDYTPRRVASVHAWFMKNGQYVNMNTGTTTAALPANVGTRQVSAAPVNTRTASVTYQNNVTNSDNVTGITITARGGTASNITYPGLGGQAAHQADYVRDISETTATAGTRMLWSPVNSAVYDIRWSFTLDSTLLPDGVLTLHYIVIDTAGNASYYTQPDITVKNKYPEITKVTLYTVNLGIGAAYTQPDEASYNLNDYRSKMFANYLNDADKAKSNSTGYLNSGFISKNNYIGFKVEADKGNRNLNFRLQHVTRERLPLNSSNVQALVSARNNADNINLYTIAWHGDYSSNNWKALGVHEENPTLGTHFVLQPALVNGSLPADFKYSNTAEVWKYTIKATKPGAAPYSVSPANQSQDMAVPVTVGPDNFKFDGTTDFTNIDEKDGSHPPDTGETKADNPADTAFFLIRVWDSVGGTATNEEAINGKLHDALVVGMNIYKTDKTDPIARLYDLNPYTEAAVTGNNLGDLYTGNAVNTDSNPYKTIRNASDPTAIGSNIVRGGLFNAGTERAMVRSGFIDPRGGSKFLNTTSNPLLNGLYDKDKQLVSGVALPDYPLKVSTDAVPASGNDKVSGRIILRGLAWDDQLIYRIQISINSGTPTTILQLNPNTAKMEAQGNNLAFVAETLNWKTGHTVEWAYVWDTGTAPATGQTVRVIAEDYKSSTANPGTNRASSPAILLAAEGATAFHNQVSVDIVPYITGFERQTPTFTTKRSLQGWYSFYQGETGIKVNGYNFGSGGATINLNGASVGTVTNGTPADKQRVFSIPSGGSSGAITMTVSNTNAYNNDSAVAGKSWNKEANTYTPGSDLWINKHYAHIWRSQEETSGNARTIIAGENDSGGMDSPTGKASPGMALQYNGNSAGRLHAVWSRYNLDTISYGDNNGAYARLNRSGDPYSATDMDYFNAGNDTYSNNVSTVALYQRDGGGRLILRPTTTQRDVNGGDDASIVVGAGPPNNANTNGRQPRSTDTERWQNPRIKKLSASTGDANPGSVIISAFDSYDKRLHYTRQSGGLSNPSGDNSTLGDTSKQYFLDGGTLNNHDNLQNLGTPNFFAAGVTANNSYGTITRSNSAGQYSAIDYDSNNYPVIAYFDEQNQTLRLLYASSDNPTAANQWTRRYVLPATHALRQGSGSYVSMKIDRARNDQIHLAFYNSNNKAVVYAVGTKTGDFTASVIDRVVEGGQWTDIAVDTGGNPWIVYADSTRTTNRDGVRMAYKSTTFARALTDPVTNTSITGWEAMTMPANYKVNNDRLNIAAWPPTGAGAGAAAASPMGGWHAAVGYASDKFRIGYFFKPTAGM